jgi:hypothetical protein
MNRRTLRRKSSDLKHTVHSLNEDEEMAAEIVMASVDAEDAHIGVLRDMEAIEKAGENILQPQQARKRRRGDTMPAEALEAGRGPQNTAGVAKRGRR